MLKKRRTLKPKKELAIYVFIKDFVLLKFIYKVLKSSKIKFFFPTFIVANYIRIWKSDIFILKKNQKMTFYTFTFIYKGQLKSNITVREKNNTLFILFM